MIGNVLKQNMFANSSKKFRLYVFIESIIIKTKTMKLD